MQWIMQESEIVGDTIHDGIEHGDGLLVAGSFECDAPFFHVRFTLTKLFYNFVFVLRNPPFNDFY